MTGYFVGAVVLDSDDYKGLSLFYLKLLDGKLIEENENYSQIELPSKLRLTFQNNGVYVAPTWPEEAGKQQAMEHLDIIVDDLEKAIATAEQLGAKKASSQFVPNMTVMLDPSGHPFCLIPVPDIFN